MKRLRVALGPNAFDTEVKTVQGKLCVSIEGQERSVRVLRGGSDALLLVAGRVVNVRSTQVSPGRERQVFRAGASLGVSLGATGAGEATSAAVAGNAPLTSPMPGRVVAIAVEPGAEVEKGQLLLVIEAMKMQNELYAAATTRVARVLVNQGDTVERGARLVEFG